MSAPPGPWRIGLVSAYDLSVPGGVQAQVLGLARQLRRAGHQVDVMAPGRPVTVQGEPASVSAGRAVAVAANGSVARLALVTSHRAVAAWTARYDLVHLHEPLAPGLPQAVLRASRRPVVATVHAQADSTALRLIGPLLRQRLRRAAALTAVSGHALATLRKHVGLDALVIGNGVAVPTALPPQPPARPSQAGAGDLVVLAVGRLSEPRKGIDVLLAAWPMIRHRHPSARLLLVGPGHPPGLAPRSLPPGVELTGKVCDDTRTGLLDAAALVVAPHLGGESFGLVVAEAMARGRCVVASSLPAFVDLLGPQAGTPPAGIIVRPGVAPALADAVAAALSDGERRRRLGAAAWQRVARHAWPLVTEQWVQAYSRALDGADTSVPPGSYDDDHD